MDAPSQCYEYTKRNEIFALKEHIIALFLCVLCMNMVYSQTYCEYKYDYIWLLGDADTDTITDEYGGSEINFNSQPPVFNYHIKAVHSPFQNASMSNKEGEFLFYSNGCSIFNSLNIQFEDGDSLNPGELYDIHCPSDGYVGFQNMISLPDMEDDSLYYIFHIDKIFNREKGAPFIVQSQHAYLTTIKISSTEPFGEIIEKNFVLLDDTSMLGSPVSAVKTSDALGWWIVTPDRWKNGFHVFKIGNSIKSYIGFHEAGDNTDPDAPGGQGKFSPNGKHFAWFHPKNGLFIYDFDRRFGVLDNFKRIFIDSDTSIIGGCEFSPSGDFLYVNHLRSLYQVDITIEDIQSSVFKIADYDGFIDPLPTNFFLMERTPDNRIFMNTANGTQYLHVIQNPNRKGLACNFEQHAIKLPTVNNFTFPHFPNYRLGPADEPLCDSFTVSTSDIPEDNFRKVNNVFPNPANGQAKIEYQHKVKHISVVSSIGMEGNIPYHVEQGYIYLNTAQLADGLYFVSIINEEGEISVSKLVIAH